MSYRHQIMKLINLREPRLRPGVVQDLQALRAARFGHAVDAVRRAAAATGRH
jgi:hypothetical protein